MREKKKKQDRKHSFLWNPLTGSIGMNNFAEEAEINNLEIAR